MKIRQSPSMTSPKNNKKTRQTLQTTPFSSTIPNRTNNPINIKLAKEKSKAKKQNKDKVKVEDKKTKRKEKKKCASQLDSTIIFKQCMDSRESKKLQSTTPKIKSRTTEKYYRASSKPEHKSKLNDDWLSAFMEGATVHQSANTRKSLKKQRRKVTLPNQEFLFLGEDFYCVDKLCPTKRILNTFRDVCFDSKSTDKFVVQDNSDKPLKINLKSNNIFAEARKQIQLKNKTIKVLIIQKWWRKILQQRNFQIVKASKQNLDSEFYQSNEEKVHFEPDSEEQFRSPFEISQLNQSPIPNKDSNHQDSIIASFNSVESMEEHPKKILLTKQNLTNLLSHQYKLPKQNEVNSQQNEEIFSNYSQFKQKEDEKNIQAKKEQENTQKVIFRPAISDSQHMDLLRELEQANKVKEMIEMRIIQQKGQIKAPETYRSRISINTNIIAIHSFLIKFFNFYIQQHREQFINLINMPFGNSIQARLRHLHGQPLPQMEEQDEEGVIFGLTNIIDQDKVSQYYDYLETNQVNKNSTFNANMELERIHHQAIIDYFNEQLNSYRPYKQINGVPYPWNNTYKALTFYFVTEQNIAEIFQKTQIAILKSCSMLTGIHLPFPQLKMSQSNPFEFDLLQWMQQYETKSHGLILEYNQDKQLKQIHEDVKKQSFEVDSQTNTGLLIEISKYLFDHLAAQVVVQMANYQMC